MRSGGRGMSRFTAGLVALVAIVGFSLGAWFKFNPFDHPFKLNADFRNASNLAPRSPVRIAGIEVGKVSAVEPLGGGGARVEMELDDEALPIHADAELKVRPRIFLGGNFFVELEPGSPSSPTVEDGATIPRKQTAAPVQLTDVLGSLQGDTRRNLQTLVREYARGLDRGGAEGIRRGLPHLAPALRDSALTSDAALGQDPKADVPRGLRGTQRTVGALDEDEQALKGLVTDLSITTGALAREDGALEASVPALRDTLRTALPALASLNGAFPSLRTIAAEARPGVRVLGPATTAARPLLRQARALVRPAELQGAVRVLRKRTPDLYALIDRSVGVFEQGRAASRCTADVLVPFIDSDFPDPDFPASSGSVNQKLQRTFVGLAGESRLTDSNQSYFHTAFVPPPASARPAPPPDGGVAPPPRRPDIPCETQEPPNLSAPGVLVSPDGTLAKLNANRATKASRAPNPARRRALLKAKTLMTDWQRKLGRRQARVLERLRRERR